MANLATINNNLLADSGIDPLSVVLGSGTANQIAYWIDADNIGALTTATYPSLTELSYVKGVTSAIQTQIDSKQATLTLTTTGTSGAATLVGATLNIPQYQSVITNPVTGTGSAGQVAYWSSSSAITGENDFIWDATNNRLAIGVVTPAASIHIEGSGSTYSAPSSSNVPGIYVQNTNSASTSANAFISLRTTGAGGGNPIVSWDINGIIGWSAGIDNADSDSFKIANYWGNVDSSTRLRISLAGGLRLYAYGSGTFTGTVAYNLAVDSSGNIIEVTDGGGTVTGTGTTNYVPKWTSASAIGNSLLYDSGSRIGLGTATPLAFFHIEGNGSTYSAPNVSNVPGIYIYNTNDASTSANTFLALRTTGAGGGDPILSWDIGGVIGWSAGIDNSDGDKFKISNVWSDLAGLTRFTIDGFGNIGVGTTTPNGSSSERTIVLANNTATYYLTNAANTLRGIFALGNATSEVFIGTQTNHSFHLRTDDTARLWLTNGGNLGLGTIFVLGSYLSSATQSGVFQTATSVAKAATASDNILAFFGSNDATNPLGLFIGMQTGATVGARMVRLQGTEIGASANHILIQPDGGYVGIGNYFTSANFYQPTTLLHLSNGNSSYTSPGNNNLPCIYLTNTNSASTNAHSILTLRTNNSTGGNPFISFDIEDVTGWAMGIDNADGDSFKLNHGWNSLTSNTALRFAITTLAATFYGSVTATSLIKSGGTSSQFLKADGSVDSNTYVTGGPYLPLTGGTLTGPLTGTRLTINSDDSGVIVDVEGRHGLMKYYLYSTGLVGKNTGTDNSISTWLGRFSGTINAPTALFQDLVVDNGGRIGIGTIVPATKLTLAGGDMNIDNSSSGNSYTLFFGNEVTRNSGKCLFMESFYLKIQGHRNEGVILQGTDGNSNIQTLASFYGSNNGSFPSTAHIYPSGGKVGIATSDARTTLSIGGGSFVDSNVPAQMSTGGGGTGTYFGFNKNGTYGLLVGMSNGLDGWTAGIVRQITTDPLYFIVNNSTIAQAITSTGRIGIGTTFTIGGYMDSASQGGVIQLATNIGKTSTARDVPLSFFGSNDASNPLGLYVGMRTGSSTATRQLKLQGTEIGTSPNHIIMQPDGANIGIGGYFNQSISNYPTTLLYVSNNNSSYTSPENNNLPCIYVSNKNGSSSTAHSILALRTMGASGGDPFISMDIEGVIGWSMGCDNSDGDKFKIANAWSALDSSTRFSMETGGNATFTGTLTANSFFESSDLRLKTLIDKEIDYSAIASIEARYYKKGDREEIGYFAQDFEGILSSAISKNDEGFLNLSYNQVHTAKIAALEAKIKELESQLKNK